MLELKLCLSLSSFKQPFRAAVQSAARLGVQGVALAARDELHPRELSQSGRRQVKKACGDLGLAIAAVEFRTRRGYDVDDQLDRRVTATKEAMRLAHDLGARVVVNAVGRVPESAESPAWERLLYSLAELGHCGQHLGVTLAAETGSESGADLARLITALPVGALGVTFDPGNLIVQGFAPLEALAALGPNIVHVHATDGIRDAGRGRGVEVRLGQGEADYPALLGALEEHEYRGYLSVLGESSDRPAAELAAAVEYLRGL